MRNFEILSNDGNVATVTEPNSNKCKEEKKRTWPRDTSIKFKMADRFDGSAKHIIFTGNLFKT